MSLPLCFGVLGDPIAHSRSPAMHAAAFAALGLPHRYLAFRVAAADLGAALRGAAALGFGGLNVTIPHKQTVAGLVDQLDGVAARVGAVNTVRFVDGRIHGHCTDGQGFLRALAELGGAAPRRAAVLGAGGASLAVVDALHTEFPGAELVWVSRQPDGGGGRALPRIGWEGIEAVAGVDLLVNTTSVGMQGGPTDFPAELPLSRLAPGARVVDLVHPRVTGGWLDRAASQGACVQDGRAMLLWQGVAALELWLGEVLAPEAIEAMRAALGLPP